MRRLYLHPARGVAFSAQPCATPGANLRVGLPRVEVLARPCAGGIGQRTLRLQRRHDAPNARPRFGVTLSLGHGAVLKLTLQHPTDDFGLAYPSRFRKPLEQQILVFAQRHVFTAHGLSNYSMSLCG